jgi:hypothetical protein
MTTANRPYVRTTLFGLVALLAVWPAVYGQPILCGRTDRPVEIDANGVSLVTHVVPPAGLVDRAVEIDANGLSLTTHVTPPAGLVDRGVEIDANGLSLVTHVTPPAGLVDRTVEIDANGLSLVTHVVPPEGLIDRPAEISPTGAGLFFAASAIPALTGAGLLVLVMLLILAGTLVLRRRMRAQPG